MITQDAKQERLSAAKTQPRAHHLMLLLHLCDLLGVLLVHLLQFPHHAFAALAQSLFVADQLKEDGARLRPQGRHGVTRTLRVLLPDR